MSCQVAIFHDSLSVSVNLVHDTSLGKVIFLGYGLMAVTCFECVIPSLLTVGISLPAACPGLSLLVTFLVTVLVTVLGRDVHVWTERVPPGASHEATCFPLSHSLLLVMLASFPSIQMSHNRGDGFK